MRSLVIGSLMMAIAAVAGATEGGGSVWPIGVETVFTGTAPNPGSTLLAMFDDFYQANQLSGPSGQSLVPGFHLRVEAVAAKVVHNWGVKFLGGNLISYVGVPILYEHLTGPFGKGDKLGVSNTIFQPAAVAYHHGDWHWWYGANYYAPGMSYQKGALLNVGQHNSAVAVLATFSYLPNHAKTEISSQVQYIYNFTDGATDYRSGNEMVWEWDAMRNLSKNLAVGINGYYYQQTTDDLLNGLSVPDGNRGRDVTVGPQIRYHVPHAVLVAKYQRDTLVQSRPCGNAFWIELAIPIEHKEK